MTQKKENKVLILPVIVDKIESLKDGSLKVTMETPELSSENAAALFEYRNKQVIAFLSETQVSPDQLNIKDVSVEFKNDKTPSQRLRSVLYVYWEQNKPTQDFETFYSRKIEDFIKIVKDKLS